MHELTAAYFADPIVFVVVYRINSHLLHRKRDGLHYSALRMWIQFSKSAMYRMQLGHPRCLTYTYTITVSRVGCWQQWKCTTWRGRSSKRDQRFNDRCGYEDGCGHRISRIVVSNLMAKQVMSNSAVVWLFSSCENEYDIGQLWMVRWIPLWRCN